jgi:hypothetical protein
MRIAFLLLVFMLTAAAFSQTEAPAYTPKFPGDPAHSNAEAAALGYMRTVGMAQRAYNKKHGGYATSLAALVGSGSFTRRMTSTLPTGPSIWTKPAPYAARRENSPPRRQNQSRNDRCLPGNCDQILFCVRDNRLRLVHETVGVSDPVPLNIGSTEISFVCAVRRTLR